MPGKIIYVIAALCCAACAAPPLQQRYQHAPAQLQQINPLAYYLDNQGVNNYYGGAEQKQVDPSGQNVPARLETLEPDSEVELVPGVQPQQPPQQNPVAPNVPGLLPGQRVFIVHMPVPGYRPGTVGGYQPVYIVAAGAQGNQAYPGNGFQNAVVLDQAGQGVAPFQFGYNRGLVGPQVLGLGYNRPYDLVYQDPRLAGQPVQAGGGDQIRFGQNIGLGLVNPITYQIPVNQAMHAQAQVKPAPAQLKQSPEDKDLAEDKTNRRVEAISRNKA